MVKGNMMGLFDRIANLTKPTNKYMPNSSQNAPARKPLPASLVDSYEKKMAGVYEDILADKLGPSARPGNIAKSAVFTPSSMASYLRKDPEDLKETFFSFGTQPMPRVSQCNKMKARFRLSFEVYARYGAPTPKEIVDYLDDIGCFLDLSDAAEFYNG